MRPDLWPLVSLFLRLGLTAFGGPAAHIALMRQEVVERRQWLTEAQFLDLVGAANLIPGPSSTEVALHIGYLRARGVGLVLAGVCFILPAALLVCAIAWAYTHFGRLPAVIGVLYGVKPVVIAVVAQALWGLGRTALKTRILKGIGIAAILAAFGGVHPLLLLLGAGIVTSSVGWATERKKPTLSETEGEQFHSGVGLLTALRPLFTLILWIALFSSASLLLGRYLPAQTHATLSALFLAFLKLGSVVYGSGYVLLAFLRSDLVVQRHWLTTTQLLDATAVGQVTPGPVFTTATFIGFVLAGPRGALVATLGMFLPAFLFVALSRSLVPRLRRSPIASAFLDGVNVASLALMVTVTWQLGQDALRDGVAFVVAGVSALLLFRYRVNSAWLVLGGALVGIAAPGGKDVSVTIGDMTTTRVPGTFRLVYLVWNAIMNVTTQDEQVAVFTNAARHLEQGGSFVVEVAVPQPPTLRNEEVGRVFKLQPDHIGIETYDDRVRQISSSHHWMVVGGRLVQHSAPYRYVYPSELDLMGRIAGLPLKNRWAGWDRAPFTADSTSQVAVFEKPA